MHESLLAKDVVDLILTEAHKYGAKKILAAKITVSDTESINKEAFDFHIKNYSQKTMLENVEIQIELVHVPVVCESCGAKYFTDSHTNICEKCGTPSIRPEKEEGVKIEYIDIDV